MKFILCSIFLFGMIVMMPPNIFAEEIPEWVKNTAGWWSDDLISETEFVNAIEYLINAQIIFVENTTSTTKSEQVPEWVKNTAGWWSDGQISDSAFIDGIEYLIKDGIISLEKNKCNPLLDKNHNNIPDEIENLPDLNGISSYELTKTTHTFQNRDWSNCTMPNELSFYSFYSVDFTNADFSNKNLFASYFYDSTFLDTNFSNSKLHGAVFLNTTLDNVDFTNADFSLETYESPFIHFSLYDSGVYTHCPYKPCVFHQQAGLDIPSNFINQKLFGDNTLPLNIKQERQILDHSDFRIIYRLMPMFSSSDIKNTNFNNSDLSHAIFGNSKITNVDFSQSDISQSSFYYSYFEKVKFENDFYDKNEYVEFLENNEQKPYLINSILEQKFEKNVNFSDIILKNVIDTPPINWSMGMTLYDEKLFVANTDDHTIDVFETDNFELIQTFTSPLQNGCETTNTFTKKTECENSLRNLPTSLTILDEKIFVSYGFQNHIQIFDLDGNFIKKFGETGDEQGKFISPFDIISHKNELFVLDAGNQRIQVFDNDGIFLREFSIINADRLGSFPSYTLNLEKMDISIYEDELFIMDSNESSVKKFTLGGKLIDTIYMSEIKPKSITSVSVADNLLLVTDSEMNKIFIFTLNGEQILSFGNFGNLYGEFSSPQDVLFDGKKIFVSDAYNYRIQIFELIP